MALILIFKNISRNVKNANFFNIFPENQSQITAHVSTVMLVISVFHSTVRNSVGQWMYKLV